MHRARAAVLSLAILGACSDNHPSSPFDGLPLELDIVAGMSAPVHVARDKYGIAHIDAQSLADAAFAQGYVMAHDRLPQMDILRRSGAGTLSELYGATDPTVIDTDLEMRMHRMLPLAEESWVAIQEAADAGSKYDAEVVTLLQRFSDGVNAYAHSISTDARDAQWVLDPNVLGSFDPAHFRDWAPVDSLVIGRYEAFAMSYSADSEIDATTLYQGLRDTFDAATSGAAGARAGISKDLFAIQPIGMDSTLQGFPNVQNDDGSRSDGDDVSQRLGTARAAASPAVRPAVPASVLARARTFFAHGVPRAGGNTWAVTRDGMSAHGMLAGDQHLPLSNPSTFYPTHIVIHGMHVESTIAGHAPEIEDFELLGVTFPGIPGIVIGTNNVVAWSSTPSEHDVNDVYLEQFVPCGGEGGSNCVAFNGTPVPTESFTESISVGNLGTPTQADIVATYEVVPHHGPIIPEIDRVNHTLVPRTDTTALSVRYTGYEPTFEIRALWKLARTAGSLNDGFRALADVGYGSQNWTLVDRLDYIAWTTHATVPDRSPEAMTWNATTNPDGNAPFFVLPGDGSAEWTGTMATRYIPHATEDFNQPQLAEPFLVSVDADPVGATFDGDPLNQYDASGAQLYAGVAYDGGVRQARITEQLRAAVAGSDPIDAETMMRIQRDTQSNMGRRLAPPIVAALDKLATGAVAPADLVTFRASLTTEQRTELETARALLVDWAPDYATPTGLGNTAPQIRASAATVLFNTWMHFFIDRALSDEIAEAVPSFDVWRLGDTALANIVYGLLVRPAQFVQGPSGEPVVCDDMTSASDDSCTVQILRSLLAAMDQLASPAGYGTTDVGQWAWGKKHTLRISPLVPNALLDLPPSDQAAVPRAGDNVAVDRADHGWEDLDFSQVADGPAQRFVAEVAYGASDNQIVVHWALPGGVIYDSRSPHYRDLLDSYYLTEQYFVPPRTADEINAQGESRWIFE
ncbi:MAG TPA: penicillin acylase family protein [Kofleriaceae bacterium]|jgi:penicillin amidase